MRLATIMTIAMAILGRSSGASADPVAEAIGAKLAAVLPAELGVLEVHLPASLAGADTTHISVALPGRIGPGRKSVRVRVGERATWVPVTFGVLRDAVMARRAIRAGEVITAADVVFGRAAVGPGAPASVGMVTGGTATRDIAAGAAIAADAVALPPPTPRGAQVTVVANRGAVKVSTTGVLIVAARPGDIVQVRLATTRTVARGTFVAPDTVLVGARP